MNTIREDARSVDEEITNEGVPSLDNIASPQDQVPLVCQAPLNNPVMSYGEITTDFLNLTLVMATHAQVVITQS